MDIRFDRIMRDPNVMNGQPCIRGMRLTARRVLDALVTYPDRQGLLQEYPELEDENLRQALAFAAEHVGELGMAAATDAEIFAG